MDYVQKSLKTIFYLILCLGLLLPVSEVTAQSAKKLAKQEKKRWKKQAKKYKKNPLALKSLVERNEELGSENKDLSQEVNDLKRASTADKAKISELENQIRNLRQSLDDERQAYSNLLKEMENQTPETVIDGVVFKVQIGAYEKRRVPTDLDTTDELDLESSNNLQKIVLGLFRDYIKAEELKNHLKVMGVEDVWIVSYRDGVRIPIEEALNP